jgi:hypothetical protein
MVCPIGIEPTLPAPEAGALSTELRALDLLYHFTVNQTSSQMDIYLILALNQPSLFTLANILGKI